ncbi:MAG: hypothetical protein CMK59_05830 [Proteobacteria bacterium]|nr:hypothetical protein [Pseudomonadota bacterium]
MSGYKYLYSPFLHQLDTSTSQSNSSAQTISNTDAQSKLQAHPQQENHSTLDMSMLNYMGIGSFLGASSMRHSPKQTKNTQTTVENKTSQSSTNPFNLTNLHQIEQQIKQRQLEEAIRNIQNTPISKGSIKVFKSLRKQIDRLSPDQFTRFMREILPQIQVGVNILDQSAEDADGGQFSPYRRYNWQLQSMSQDFDRAVSDLSYVMNKVAGQPNGAELAQQISQQIADLIAKRDDIGRWDEALGNTLLDAELETIDNVQDKKDVDPADLGKGTTILASQVVVSLIEKGEDGNAVKHAGDIVENIAQSASEIEKASKTLTERTMADHQLLTANNMGWGQLHAFDSNSVSNANKAAKKSHGTYDQLEALSGHSIYMFNELHKLSSLLPEAANKSKLQDQINNFTNHMADSVSLTQSGTEALENVALEASNEEKKSEGSWFDTLLTVKDRVNDGRKLSGVLASALLSPTLKGLTTHAVQGNTAACEALMRELVNKSTRLGINQEDLNSLFSNFQKLNSGTTAPETALNDFQNSVDKIKPFHTSTAIGRSLGIIGLAISSINLAASIRAQGAVKSRDGMSLDELQTRLSLMSNTVSVGNAGIKLLSTNASWVKTITSHLGTATKVLRVGSVVIGGVQTAHAISDGDWSGAAMGGLGMTSGILLLMGSTGPAALVGVAALAISIQLSRVEASNRLETEHTTAYLEQLGYSPELAHQYQNADSEGRSVGPVLFELMNFTNANPPDFVEALQSLTVNQAKDLVKACHGVDPDKENNYPETGIFDQWSGRSLEEAMNDIETIFPLIPEAYRSSHLESYIEEQVIRPHTLQGLDNYLTRSQINLH